MGIHISVVKILGFEPYEDYGQSIMIVNKEQQDWFDHLRYAGDKDFNNEVEFNYVDVPDKEEILKRPADFNIAKQWVNENIKTNPERLLIALERMEQDESLAFDVSY